VHASLRLVDGGIVTFDGLFRVTLSSALVDTDVDTCAPLAVSVSPTSASLTHTRTHICSAQSLLFIPGLLYGYDIGGTSFVLAQLVSEGGWSDFDATHQGLTIAAGSAGAFLGSYCVLLYHTLSRRAELRIAACLYCVGNLLNVLAGTLLKEYGWYFLLMGRLIFGFGVGLVMRKL
jgi:MFS family permease